MRSVLRHIILLILLIPAARLQSQTDSLEQVALNEKNDSIRFSLYIKIAKVYLMSNPDKAEGFTAKAMQIADKTGSLKQGSQVHRINGTIWYYRNDFYKAISEYETAISISEKAGDKQAIPSQYRNVALCYTKLGKNAKAADLYFKSLKIADSYQDSSVVCNIYNDLGSLFYQQKDYPKARNYFIKAYGYYKAQNNDEAIAKALNNIGSTFSQEQDYSFALVYYTKSFEMRQKIQDTLGLITSYTNIAQIYSLRRQYDKALSNDQKAVQLAEAIHYDYSLGGAYSSIAATYKEIKNYPKALEYANKAMAITEKLNDQEKLMDMHRELYEIYDAYDKPAQAMAHYRQYLVFRDSITNKESSMKALQVQMQYDFDKKQLADSIQTVETTLREAEKHQQEISEERIYSYCGMAGLALMIIVSGLAFRAYRQKRKDNMLITEQKLLVEEKQKEILDSIHYAKRIQGSLLPTEKYIQRNLKRLIQK
jgi:tetratricopeptide (TPR) repeat protein